MKIVDEIVQTVYHEREIPFKLSADEIRLMYKFLRDEFYLMRFGR